VVSQNFNFILSRDLSKYSGDWIAVANNKIVATGESASEVMSKSKKKTKKRTTIMRVPEKNTLMLL